MQSLYIPFFYFCKYWLLASEHQKTKGTKDKIMKEKKIRTVPARKQSRPLNLSYRNRSKRDIYELSEYNGSIKVRHMEAT